MNFLIITLAVLCAVSAISATSTRRDCYNSKDLKRAIDVVIPGDDIVLHPGIYFGYFHATKDGTASQPITVRSANTTDKAILRGYSLFSYYSAPLYVTGNYWSLQDLEVTYGGKGIVFDNAIGGEILNCNIHSTGEEAIHIGADSSRFLIEGNTISNTGRVEAGLGRGIYIGSDKGTTDDNYVPTVSSITVRNNVIGPDVRAEGIDVRADSHDILIENNLFNSDAFSESNFADSFIDLKGSLCVVRSNIFNQNGSRSLKHGVNVMDKVAVRSSYAHVIIGNKFNLNDNSTSMVQATTDTQNVYVFGNTRSPAGIDYTGSIIQNQVPDWYTEDTPGNKVMPQHIRASPISVSSPTPTTKPTPLPTRMPTPFPTRMRLPLPTRTPTNLPTRTPTSSPTHMPTPLPTRMPTSSPTQTSRQQTTKPPSLLPTLLPIPFPTRTPTYLPTPFPSPFPAHMPTPPLPTPLFPPLSKPFDGPVPTHSPNRLQSQRPTTLQTRVSQLFSILSPTPPLSTQSSVTFPATPSPAYAPSTALVAPSPKHLPTGIPTRRPTPSPTKPFASSRSPPLEQCDPLPTFLVSSIQSSFALVTWTQRKHAVTYKLRYRETAQVKWAEIVGVTGFAYFLTNLKPNTYHFVEIQVFCANGASSVWSPSTLFKTEGVNSLQLGASGVALPTPSPTADPTTVPTLSPTLSPTTFPTSDPTTAPTLFPTTIPSSFPTIVPTLAPSTTKPTIEVTKSYVIYANWGIHSEYWADNSSNGVFDDSFNDGGSHRSTYSAQLEPGGQVHFDSTLADLTGRTKLRFFVRSLSGSTTLRLSVNYVSGGFTADDEWRNHVLNFSYWLQGSEVKSVIFENTSERRVTLLFDDIRFVA